MIKCFDTFLRLVQKSDLFTVVNYSNSYTIYNNHAKIIATIYDQNKSVSYYSGWYYCYGDGDDENRIMIYDLHGLCIAIDENIKYLSRNTIHNIYANALDNILIELSLIENDA